jgi:hypothetical protein
MEGGECSVSGFRQACWTGFRRSLSDAQLAESRMAALEMPPAEADICILPSADNCPPLEHFQDD